jgi:hypothetical protein
MEKLSKEKGLTISLNAGSSEKQILDAEIRLNIRLPEQVKLFYFHFNGLQVDNPELEILPLARLSLRFPSRLHFAVFDGKHNIYFDVSKTNEAGQWNIVSENDYLITLTMASFWSNKIWRWLEHRKAIWTDEYQP